MEICVKNLEDDEFIIKYKDQSSIVNRDNCCVRINPFPSKDKICLINNSNYIMPEAGWKIHFKFKDWVKIIAATFLLYILDIIFFNPRSIVNLINPFILEEYMYCANDDKKYNLIYHRGYFEPITYKYHYPYMTDELGTKLKYTFILVCKNIEKNFWFAKIYHIFTAFLIACMCGIGINIIWNGLIILLVVVLLSFLIILFGISIKLDILKEKLVKQLKEDSIVKII